MPIWIQIIQVGVIALGCWGVGRMLSASLWKWPHPSLQLAAETAIGFLVLSYTLFAMSLVGWLQEPPLWGVFFALLIVGLVAVWRFRILQLSKELISSGSGDRASKFWKWSVGTLSLLIAVWVLLAATLPPNAIDELIYHLAIPRLLLEGQSWPSFSDNIYAFFPQHGEMLFTLALGVGGEVAARLIHSLHGLLLLWACYGFARRYLARSFALLSVLLLFSVPSVVVISSWAYVDLNFSLYVLLGLVAALEFRARQESRWALMAGLLFGGACSVKYMGIQVVLILLLALFVDRLWQREMFALWKIAYIPALAALILSPYLVRNWLVSGWPLFPFDIGFFSLAPSINWGSDRTVLYLKWLATFGDRSEPSSLLSTLLAPVIVFVKAGFTTGFDGAIGPVFLIGPLLLLRVRKRLASEWVPLGVFLIGFFFYWSISSQQVRFLIPILPLLATLLALGLSLVKRRALTALTLGMAFLSLSWGMWNTLNLDPFGYWLGRETRDQFLERTVIGYPIYRFVNQTLGPEDRVYLINMRNFGYYLDCNWRADFVFEYFSVAGLLARNPSVADIRNYFESKGITHFLIDESITFAETGLEAPAARLLTQFLQSQTRLIARNARLPSQSFWGLVSE